MTVRAVNADRIGAVIRDLWYALGTGAVVFMFAMQIAHGWAM